MHVVVRPFVRACGMLLFFAGLRAPCWRTTYAGEPPPTDLTLLVSACRLKGNFYDNTKIEAAAPAVNVVTPWQSEVLVYGLCSAVIVGLGRPSTRDTPEEGRKGRRRKTHEPSHGEIDGPQTNNSRQTRSGRLCFYSILIQITDCRCVGRASDRLIHSVDAPREGLISHPQFCLYTMLITWAFSDPNRHHL